MLNKSPILIKTKHAEIYISIIFFIIILSIIFFINKPKSSQIFSWGIEEVQANLVWKNNTAKNIRMAILDSGVEELHPDLKSNIKGGYNVINENNEYGDIYGHGTEIAGIICAENNNIGIVGVTPDINLYAVKVLNEYGVGTIDTLVKGINWAIENDMDIINMSLYFSVDDPSLYDAIKRAHAANIILISAAGQGEMINYPAAYEEVISVGCIDSELNILGNYNTKVDYVAPGKDVITTKINSLYGESSGTSIATAFVSATVALLISNENSYDLNYIKTKLKNTSKQLHTNDDLFYLINTYAAVN